jgi:sensor histidine kinase YesM
MNHIAPQPNDAPPSAPAGNRLVWRVAAVSAAVVVATLVITQLAISPEPSLPAGTLPRMRPAPANTTQLLRSLGVGSLVWYMCLASAPLFFWLARRFPITRARWMRASGASVLVLLAMATLTAWLQYRISYHGSPLAPSLREVLAVGVITGLLPFATVAITAYAIDAQARAHERALEAERVRAQLAESRVEALSAQLQPHFLFNTLQGISTLITRDPAAADEMLTSLSDLLRDVLRRGDRREITLAEELSILQSYLDLSRRRFGSRLTIRVEADALAKDAFVPFFVLQPLVENALQHGIGAHAGPGTVTIAARREANRLTLVVSDDGSGGPPSNSGRGVGLANTRSRLRELYGDDQSLDLSRTPLGFEARISIPYHTAPGRTASSLL